MSRPTELAITLATFPGKYNYGSEWSSADEIGNRLRLLGFECTAQQVGAYLARMARTDAPWVERQRTSWGDWEYRVTRFGRNDIDNRIPGVWWATDRMRDTVLRARAIA